MPHHIHFLVLWGDMSVCVCEHTTIIDACIWHEAYVQAFYLWAYHENIPPYTNMHIVLSTWRQGPGNQVLCSKSRNHLFGKCLEWTGAKTRNSFRFRASRYRKQGALAYTHSTMQTHRTDMNEGAKAKWINGTKRKHTWGPNEKSTQTYRWITVLTPYSILPPHHRFFPHLWARFVRAKALPSPFRGRAQSEIQTMGVKDIHHT